MTTRKELPKKATRSLNAPIEPRMADLCPSTDGSSSESVYDFYTDQSDDFEMSNFPKFKYGKRQVLRAGEALKGTLEWSEDQANDILEIFKIANNWRDSHALPMRTMRRETIGQMKRAKIIGLTVARLKTMRSIRKKLREQHWNLNQIQDLAGCRVIVPTITDVNRLAECQILNSRHEFRNADDYIQRPKPGGYRSHHLIFKFRGEGDLEAFDGRRVEIQLRTRLQHSWATAVEAVGTLNNQDLKGGKGDPDWLRLFELMSAEFAFAEQCPVGNDMPRKERVQEIIGLDRKLNAANTLDDFRNAVELSNHIYTSGNRYAYYILEYNKETKRVYLQGYQEAISGTQAYHAAEFDRVRAGDDLSNRVLVEADQVETLKKAYPNYFGDTALFTENLKRITRGKEAIEYTLPPRPKAPPMRKVQEQPDLSWFREHRRRRWN